MSRLTTNLTDEEKRERARRWDERRKAAARRYEQSLRDSGASKYRDLGTNEKRRRKRFSRAYGSESRVRWMHRQPCLVCRKCPTEVAHVVSRAAGGTADDCVPLCAFHHRQQHDMGVQSFAEFYNIDLSAAAREYAEAWEERE